MPSASRSAAATVILQAMNSPHYEWTRHARVRRRLVLVSALLTGLLVALLWKSGVALQAKEKGAALAWFAGGVVAMLTWMYVIGCLNASVRGAADPIVRLAGGHDEMQREWHADVHRRSYWPMVVLLSIASFVTIMARLSILPALALFLASYTAAAAMPLWLLAWTLPDD